MRIRRAYPHARAAAKSLRKHQTSLETKIWALVRNRQLLGLKFRRQHPIGRFVVDFYCSEIGLVLELEGGIHSIPSKLVADQERAAVLRGMGLRVARVRNVDGTFDNLQRLIAGLPFPSPVRERGQG